MRHEKHTQSFRIPEALALPSNAAAADGDPMSVPLLPVHAKQTTTADLPSEVSTLKNIKTKTLTELLQ